MATTTLQWLSPLIPESRTTQAILIGLAISVVVYNLTKKRYKYPPGPMGLPLLGNLLALRNSNIMEKMPEWEKKYGPVVTVYLGPLRAIVLNSYEVIREAFVQKSTDFAGRPKIYSLDKITEGSKDIVVAAYGPIWQLQRRLGLRALGFYMKGSNFENTISDVLEMVFQDMRKEKRPFNIQTYTTLIVFNLLSKICFSEMYTKDDKEFKHICGLFDKADAEFSSGFLEDAIPPLRLFPTRRFRRVMAMFDEILDYIFTRINQHKKTFSPDIQRDLTDAILIAQKELAAEESPDRLAEITDTHFAQTIFDVFTAGIDTTKQTLNWTILYIAAHPDVQAKIHQEVDSVLGARVIPLMSDRTNLPYTEAVLHESMRIATVVPFSVPRATTCDTSIGGYTIPKGTFVAPNLFAIHHDTQVWKEPWKFRPERFLDSSGKYAKPEGWMPFSVGKRSCMAETLAKPELHMILAALYRNFEIRMPEGVTADLEPAESSRVYLSKPYKVTIKDRFI